jgi:nitroreductase
MEFQAVVQRRKMVRSFTDRPVPPEAVDRILGNAQRAPSAGFAQGWAFVVLAGPAETAVFWHHMAEPEWLAQPDHPGLLRAPVIIVALAHKQAYLDRYREPDKAASARADEADWPVPYWLVDTAFATMAMLLTAVDAGLGALFFGLARGQDALMAALGVPPDFQPIGAVAVGWPDDQDRRSPSLARGRRPPETVVHLGHW